MNALKPITVGVSLSATAVVLYLLCALTVWIAPGGVAAALNLVAHGMNLAPLFQQVAEMSLLSLLGGTLLLAAYFFVAGWLFAWIYNRFLGP
jgi:hypothetical protein